MRHGNSTAQSEHTRSVGELETVTNELSLAFSFPLDCVPWPDRRQQVLARLAVGEPGENWVNEEYSWSYAQRSGFRMAV